ncbi:hypothetical protein Emag_000245 [Eimeria magna]
MTGRSANSGIASKAKSRPAGVSTKSASASSKIGGNSSVSVVSPESSAPSPASPPPSFNPRRFIRLVVTTGILAAVASVFGKLAFDFSPRAAVQILSARLAQRLLPADALEYISSSSSSSVVLEANPQGFPALLRNIWKFLLLLTVGHSSSSSSSHPPLSSSSSSEDAKPAELPLATAAAAAALSFYCLVLLIRGCLFGCMLACNACMLQSHVKCLVAAPSAGSSSVSIFAANFISSVLLSWLLLGEQLTLGFGVGAACMLAGTLFSRGPPQRLQVFALLAKASSPAKMEQQTSSSSSSSSSSRMSEEAVDSSAVNVETSANERQDTRPSSVREADPQAVSADSVREEGLKAFKAGDWQGASEAWSRGLRILEYILAKEEEFDAEKKNEFVAMQQSYLLNLSLSTLKEGRWSACIIYCDKALKVDPTSTKALYRKAQAQQALGELDGAIETTERFLRLSPQSPLASSLHAQLRHQKAAHAIKEKRLLQGMFRSLEHDPRSEASAAAAAAAGERTEGGLLQAIGSKVKGWFGSVRREGEKPVSPKHEEEQQANRLEQQLQQLQQQQQQLSGKLAALQRPLGGEFGPSSMHARGAPAAAAAAARGSSSEQQEALREAFDALGGNPSAASNGDLQHLLRLVKAYQKISSGDATLKDRLSFGLLLAWLGLRQFCVKGCRYLCRRRQSQTARGDVTASGPMDHTTDAAAAYAERMRLNEEEVSEDRAASSRAHRKQQTRAAAAQAARRRVQRQKQQQQQQQQQKHTALSGSAFSSSRFEDLDELEASLLQK